MTVLDTDLTTETDAVLDATLQRVFTEHRAASDAGDVAEKRICAQMAASIIAEQGRRLDVWIEQHA